MQCDIVKSIVRKGRTCSKRTSTVKEARNVDHRLVRLTGEAFKTNITKKKKNLETRLRTKRTQGQAKDKRKTAGGMGPGAGTPTMARRNVVFFLRLGAIAGLICFFVFNGFG